jgi:hypothetical protein
MNAQIQLRLEFQLNAVADEVSAVTAVVRPILLGILLSLKREVVDEMGGHSNVKLFMLPRLRRPGDGDIGICFEYAVHDALTRKDPIVTDRVASALVMCGVEGLSIGSILFGAEKSGSLTLIDTAKSILTDDSALIYGQGRPLKLKRHIDSIAEAFRKPSKRESLPDSVSDLWRADLFTGDVSTDKWIGTTLKVNRDELKAGNGLRLGIVPCKESESDAITRDDSRDLVICPLPYDHSFMQVFYQAWQVVVQFLYADAKVPREAFLPRPACRQVARYLEERRDHPVLEVLEALIPLSQPELLRTEERNVGLEETASQSSETTAAIVAPMPEKKVPTTKSRGKC